MAQYDLKKLSFAKNGNTYSIGGSNLYVFELDMVTMSTAGAYSHDTTGLATTSTMKAIHIECSNPSIFKDKITVTVNTGGITLACDNTGVGSSYVTVTVIDI